MFFMAYCKVNQVKTFKVKMINKVKITYKVINLERVQGSCVISKELKNKLL